MPIGGSWSKPSGRHARAAETRGATIASFWKRCIILRFITSPGEPLPAEFGRWNSVWKRFWRLSQRGVFEAMLGILAAMSGTAHLVQMVDSTIVRAHVSAAGAKGGRTAKRSAARAAGFPPKST